MPFKSKAQQKKFYELEKQGKISRSEVQKWSAATKNIKSLPERITKKK